MDFAFAPNIAGDTGKTVRGMFDRKSNTTHILAKRNLATLHEFIEHLNTSSAVTKPIDNLLLATHANSQGTLTTARMFPAQTRSTNYEILEDTMSLPANSIAVPNTLIGHTPGTPVIHYFHLKGCNIGKVTPFLTKMKQALGGVVKLTTPLHFDEFIMTRNHGVFEMLAYEFRIIRKTAFPSRADYISALNTNPTFKFYDGATIPLTDWESWVPARIDRTDIKLVNHPMGSTIKRKSTLDFKQQFRYKHEPYTVNINFPSLSQIPTTHATQMTVLQTFLSTKKFRPSDPITAFDPAHPFPEHTRWGYTDLQNFINEHEWKFTIIKKTLTLNCQGFFHAYTLLIPILDRTAATAGNILFNFYPDAGSGLSEVIKLPETDPAFFSTT